MNRAVLLEALDAYRLTCGARAHSKKQIGDKTWMGWAQRGAEVEEMVRQIKAGEIIWVEQRTLEV